MTDNNTHYTAEVLGQYARELKAEGFTKDVIDSLVRAAGVATASRRVVVKAREEVPTPCRCFKCQSALDALLTPSANDSLPTLPDGQEWLKITVPVSLDALRANPEGMAEAVAQIAAESARREALKRGAE